jgi:uncharacterized protein (DUF2236 family)
VYHLCDLRHDENAEHPTLVRPFRHSWPALLDALPFAERLRTRLEAQILGLVAGRGAPTINFREPSGDPGLFGPDAVCWAVHADFPSMLAGGISALLLQMLHPLALAGVVDHSNFREDMLGRLSRTATFIAGTTYGSREDAERLVERVKKVHRTVVGTAPDGRPYAADDPALLTWVHVAEVDSFLRAHLVYVDPSLSLAAQDRYYDETALVAEKLGARDVPRSRAAVLAYFEKMRPSLAVTEQTREVAGILLHATAPNGGHPGRAVGRAFMAAGIDLLPAWAQALAGYDDNFAPLRGPAARATVRAVAPALRWALRDGAAARARQRCGRTEPGRTSAAPDQHAPASASASSAGGGRAILRAGAPQR